MKLIIYLVFVCSLLSFSTRVSGSFIVLSASQSGRYLILQSTSDNRKILVDFNGVKIICEFDSSFVPITWLKDSLILFQRDSVNETVFLSYNVKKGRYAVFGKIIGNSFFKKAGDADWVSFPNNIANLDDVFFVYLEGKKLYQYLFKEQKAQELLILPLGNEEEISNISINNDCSSILYASRLKGKGRVFLMDLKSGKMRFEEKGEILGGKASVAYFLQRDNEALIYSVSGGRRSNRTFRIDLLNIRERNLTKVSYLTCSGLLNPFGIYSKRILLINILNPLHLKIGIGDSIYGDLALRAFRPR